MKTLEQLEQMLEKAKEYIKKNDLKTLIYNHQIIKTKLDAMEKTLIKTKKEVAKVGNHLLLLDQKTDADLSKLKLCIERMEEIKDYTWRLKQILEKEIESREKNEN